MRPRLRSYSHMRSTGTAIPVRSAITGLADGLDSEALADLLEAQKNTRREEVMSVSNWFSQMGGYAPTIGIVGTVASLIHVMENLAAPDQIGHMIAAAFVACGISPRASFEDKSPTEPAPHATAKRAEAPAADAPSVGSVQAPQDVPAQAEPVWVEARQRETMLEIAAD